MRAPVSAGEVCVGPAVASGAGSRQDLRALVYLRFFSERSQAGGGRSQIRSPFQPTQRRGAGAAFSVSLWLAGAGSAIWTARARLCRMLHVAGAETGGARLRGRRPLALAARLQVGASLPDRTLGVGTEQRRIILRF